MADVNEKELQQAEAEIAEIIGKDNVLAVVTDVSSLAQVEHLRDEAFKKFGEVRSSFFLSITAYILIMPFWSRISHIVLGSNLLHYA